MTSISLIIVATAPRLLAAVESAAAQTYPQIEIIVVEPPNSPISSAARQAVGRYGFPVVRLPTTRTGTAALHNAAVRACRTEWLAFLTPSDILASTYVTDCAALFDSGTAFITSWSRFSGNVEVRTSGPHVDLPDVLGQPALVHPSTFFRRDVWQLLGGFAEDLGELDLYDFWIRILTNRFRGAVVQKVLVTRRPGSFESLPLNQLTTRPLEHLFRRHHEAFDTHFVVSLLERDRHRESLRHGNAALRERNGLSERELRRLDAEVEDVTSALRRVGGHRVEWGDFDRVTPLSTGSGDRGDYVDTYYIERFLETRAADIGGIVLEDRDDEYTRRYGGDRLVRSDIIDVDPTNPRATVIADLRDAATIPTATYDCIILTATLHVIYDVRAVLGECVRILKPGGVLLATLPFARGVAPEYGPDGDFWRFTESTTRRLFGEFFLPERLTVSSHGNILVNIAYLFGLACDELTDREFQVDDPFFPLVITVRARA